MAGTATDADPIEEQLDLHPALHGGDQRVGELLADLVRPEDVALEQDGGLRLADRREHGGEGGGAVAKQPHRVAAGNVRRGNAPQTASE